MRKKLTISIVPIAILIGCGDNEKSAVVINSIEKSITKEQTNLGCGAKKSIGEVEPKECLELEDENSSAKFILNILAKDEDEEVYDEDIVSIKENLNISLKEISKEVNRKIELKNRLMELVEEMDNEHGATKRNLKKFVDNVYNDEVLSSSKRDLIKSRIESLINGHLTNDEKPSNVKDKLKYLIDNISESKRSLSQTEKSLTTLIEDVERKRNPSVKKFASAIIKDVTDRKISIIKESSRYYIIKVQSGDNLSILAKRYYNDMSKFKLIYEANRDKINSKYEIFPDTELLIPKI